VASTAAFRLDPAERKALGLSVFAAACICLAPFEAVSAVLLLVVAALLYRWDMRLTAREEAARPTPAPALEEAEPVAAPGPDEPT
jgi:hypothetical protein